MSAAGPDRPGESFNQPGGKGNKRNEERGMPAPGQEGGAPAGSQGAPYGEGRGKHKPEGVSAPPAGAPPAGAGPAAAAAGEAQHEGKKKAEKEASPVPSPQ